MTRQDIEKLKEFIGRKKREAGVEVEVLSVFEKLIEHVEEIERELETANEVLNNHET